MKIQREGIRTGLIAIVSIVIFVAVVIYLGSPGVFIKQKSYRIFFDNAAALSPGADVLLAGRKIGRVQTLYSPVTLEDRPKPELEVLVEVSVNEDAVIYRDVTVTVAQPKLLNDPVIDFVSGRPSSGLAEDGATFVGIRPPRLEEMVPLVLDQVKPVLEEATETIATIRETAEGPFKNAVTNIESMTEADGDLRMALDNVRNLTGPESELAAAIRDIHELAENLTENDDIDRALRSIRATSEDLEKTIRELRPRAQTIALNLEQASDTVKRQPWRLFWPGTKDYDEDGEEEKPTKR